jgi:hypothetical protein
MQLKKLLLSAGLVLAAASAFADAKPFEGVVSYQVTRPGSDTPMDMKMSLSGGKWRIDGQGPRGGQGAIIVDPKAKTMITLMTARKMYMSRTFAPKPKPAAAPKITKTGKTDTVAGYKVEEWEVTAGDKTSEMWVTNEIGSMNFALMGGAQSASVDIPEEIKNGGFFPLRIEGAKGVKMEATKVEPGALDPSLFQAPADYKLVDMGAMGGGAGGMSPETMEKMKANMSPEQYEMMQKAMQKQPAAAGGN